MRCPTVLACVRALVVVGAAGAARAGEDPGFGGAAVVEFDSVRSENVDASASLHGAPAAFAPRIVDVTPTPTTALEDELARAHIDPAAHPLVQLRVDVARAEAAIAALEKRGASLSTKGPAEAELARARDILDEVERIAMHRLNVCAQRSGRGVVVKNYRMTAGGPVMLSTSEMTAQAGVIDPPGCARIDLIDAAVVDRVRRARVLRTTLATTDFPYHRLDERRALEEELHALEAELAKEAMPALAVTGARDPFGARR